MDRKIYLIHRMLMDKKDKPSKTLEDFEAKLIEKFYITSSEISNPEIYWKKSEFPDADKSDNNTEEYQNCLSNKMLSTCLDHTKFKKENDNKEISTTSSINRDFTENEIQLNSETCENELILIKSKKNILIDLIDKEIDRYSNKNILKTIQDQSVDEIGAGDSIKKYEEKQKRLSIIAKIKNELEIWENFELSVE